MLVVLYGGDERVNSVMGLCAGFGAKLVRGESVVKLSVYCQSGSEETLKKLGKGVIDIYAPVGGRVGCVFVMAFIDGLHEGELPISWLHVGFPYAIEE